MGRVVLLCHNGRLLDWPVRRCESFGSRSRGMLGSRCAGTRQVWRLQPCNAVHSMGMREAIDLAFCGAGGRILRLVEALPPWRLRWVPGARSVWEFPAGSLRQLKLQCGDWLMAMETQEPGR
ncbi:MAG: DUF192 domain-containing protein [Steroidobacteraceae bacterium]